MRAVESSGIDPDAACCSLTAAVREEQPTTEVTLIGRLEPRAGNSQASSATGLKPVQWLGLLKGGL